MQTTVDMMVVVVVVVEAVVDGGEGKKDGEGMFVRVHAAETDSGTQSERGTEGGIGGGGGGGGCRLERRIGSYSMESSG